LVVDAADADVWADEPIWRDGQVVGFVTSGGYAHAAEKSVALGFVPSELIQEGAKFEIEILGDLRPATLITEPLFDPKGERMRG
jgi:dimethylglycine dehydrogenase